MDFILSGGMRDARPSGSQPNIAMARASIIQKARAGAMMPVPQQQYRPTNVPRLGFSLQVAPPHQQPSYNSGMRSTQPAQQMYYSGLRAPRYVGRAEPAEQMDVAVADECGDEAHVHAEEHEDHVDVQVDVHAEGDNGVEQEAEEELMVTATLQPSDSPIVSEPEEMLVVRKKLSFHTSDKLLHLIERGRKSIVQAIVRGDTLAVERELSRILHDLQWPRVCLHHHDSYHHASVHDSPITRLYEHGTVPVTDGHINVLYSSVSLKPNTPLIQLCGWLLPWGMYESLATLKLRQRQAESSNSNSSEFQESTRSSKLSLHQHIMHERVVSGPHYALWVMRDHDDGTNTASEHSHDHVLADVRALQLAHDVQDSSAHKCNVQLVHHMDDEGRQLTWLETTQHVAPNTLLCADLGEFYADLP